MNKEYIHIHGKAIVRDEDGCQKLIEYKDNLEEILIKENIIETIENKISKLEKQLVKYEKMPKIFIPSIAIIMTLMAIFIPKILFSIFKSFGGIDLYQEMINSSRIVISTADFTSYFIWGICFIFGSYLTMIDYSNYKRNKKEYNGINSELTYLQKILTLEKNNLEKLKSESKKVSLEEEFSVNKVNDKYDLENLDELMNLFYSLGYCENKYLRYFKKGILDKKLESEYTSLGIDIVKEHFEKKEKTLVKKR